VAACLRSIFSLIGLRWVDGWLFHPQRTDEAEGEEEGGGDLQPRLAGEVTSLLRALVGVRGSGLVDRGGCRFRRPTRLFSRRSLWSPLWLMRRQRRRRRRRQRRTPPRRVRCRRCARRPSPSLRGCGRRRLRSQPRRRWQPREARCGRAPHVTVAATFGRAVRSRAASARHFWWSSAPPLPARRQHRSTATRDGGRRFAVGRTWRRERLGAGPSRPCFIRRRRSVD